MARKNSPGCGCCGCNSLSCPGENIALTLDISDDYWGTGQLFWTSGCIWMGCILSSYAGLSPCGAVITPVFYRLDLTTGTPVLTRSYKVTTILPLCPAAGTCSDIANLSDQSQLWKTTSCGPFHATWLGNDRPAWFGAGHARTITVSTPP